MDDRRDFAAVAPPRPRISLRLDLALLVMLMASVPLAIIGVVSLRVNAETLESTREHERVHVRQYERWGAALIPAYVVAGAAVALRGGDPRSDIVFERAARGAG